MPEIKNQFTSGKMNKDLDERLIPKGEYRDAMNIQVSTSEGSDVGTVQNILGNIEGCQIEEGDNRFGDMPNSKVIASVSDEKNDTLYWFLAGPTAQNSLDAYTSDSDSDLLLLRDIIMRKASDNCQYVFVDLHSIITQTDLASNNNTLGMSGDAMNFIRPGMQVTGYGPNGAQTSTSPTIISVGESSTIGPVAFNYNFDYNPQQLAAWSGGGFQVIPVVEWDGITATYTNQILVPAGGDIAAPPSGGVNQSNYSATINNGYVAGSSAWENEIINNNLLLNPTTDWQLTGSSGGSSYDYLPPGTTVINTELVILNSTDTEFWTLVTFSNMITAPPNAPIVTAVSNTNFPLYYGAYGPFGFIHINDNGGVIQTAYSSGSATFALSAEATIQVPTANNSISLPPNSNIADEIYAILGNLSSTTQITIQSSSFPSGSCIDPTSVTSGVDYEYDVVQCVTSAAVAPIGNGPTGYITFVTDDGSILTDQVLLNENIDLSSGNFNTLLFKADRVLDFDQNRLVTGLNIIDDMLFWTDGVTEPKKINITRSTQGTIDGTTHTKLINTEIVQDVDAEEEHITVIRKSPNSALQLDVNPNYDETKNYSGLITISTALDPGLSSFTSYSSTNNRYDFSNMTSDDGNNLFRVNIAENLTGGNTFYLQDWEVGAKVVLKENLDGDIPPVPIIEDYRIKGTIVDWSGNKFTSTPGNPASVSIQVDSITGTPPGVPIGDSVAGYTIDLFRPSKNIFEFKFPRFSYRYKFNDGEYSCLAPFSEVGFLPGPFQYHPKRGYNTGMSNTAHSFILKGFNIQGDIPKDVTEIDIIYKDDHNPAIYVVDTISPKDDASVNVDGTLWNNWDLQSYTITRDTIKATLPPNQLLRPWDNVPRSAIAQDITGNRIVYGNYVQNYNLKTDQGVYNPKFKKQIVRSSSGIKSIKSLREYQLGIVFSDKYGRETPVITNESGTFKIDKIDSFNKNKLKVGLLGSNIPEHMESYKFFIKQTSGEYYNMAMDRYYDAGDGNLWLAFASSDRNKVDIDTFLILKKGQETSDIIKEPAKYKIIAIENEAPDFIKLDKQLIVSRQNDDSEQTNATVALFTSDNFDDGPRYGRSEFIVPYKAFAATAANALNEMMEKEEGCEIWIDFSSSTKSGRSKRHKVTSVTVNDGQELKNITAQTPAALWEDAKYHFKLEESFDETINFITNDPRGETSSEIDSSAIMNIYKYSLKNKPEFDGRFFVKVFSDPVFDKYIKPRVISGGDYEVSESIQLFGMRPDIQQTHDNNVNNSTLEAAFYLDLPDQTPTEILNQGFWAYFGQYQTPDDQTLQGENDDRKRFEAIGYPDKEGGFGKEPIWFIDQGPTNGTSLTDDLRTGKQDAGGFNRYLGEINGDNFNGVGVVNSTYFDQDASTIEIGVGGLEAHWDDLSCHYDSYYNDKCTEYSTLKDHFDLETHGMGGIKQKLQSGYQFMFTQDPNQTIYTIQENITQFQKLRMFADPTQYFDRFMYRSNFTKNYKMQVVPRISDNWDPWVGDAQGMIINGIELDVAAQGVGTTGTMFNDGYGTIDDLYITVATIEATWNGKTYLLTKGMALCEVADPSGGADHTCADIGFAHGGERIMAIRDIDVPVDGSGDPYKLYLGGLNGPIRPEELAWWTNFVSNSTGFNLKFKQPVLNGTTMSSAPYMFPDEISGVDDFSAQVSINYTLDFIEMPESNSVIPEDPAVWETEPKDEVDLDLYYEISSKNPIQLNSDNIASTLPIGSAVSTLNGGDWGLKEIIANESVLGDYIKISNKLCVNTAGCVSILRSDPGLTVYDSPVEIGDEFEIKKQDGTVLNVVIKGWDVMTGDNSFAVDFYIETFLYNSNHELNWHNCYSWGNGVESNRIRDSFNLPYLSTGVKASTTLAEQYKRENRKNGLIYSGIYNSTSGVNNLNQFIQAEKITKDLSPTYGSIQKLHAGWGQSGDLIALCEDRVLKVLANKDALYNADGDTNVTSTNNVLGTATPYSGEFGISTNPESFASESYRAYFTDKVRGTVMRLSMDGLTPISDHGMRDYFKDHLRENNKIIGNYDDKKQEYNITLPQTMNNGINGTTVSFKEDVKGWVSFKSFIPENAISCANKYYTFKDGKIWQHHDETQLNNRNTFYGEHGESMVDIILNDAPNVVKSFQTINYEGSQSKIDQFRTWTSPNGSALGDGEHYNLNATNGWYVSDHGVKTNIETGTINEFIEKEGKWFNYIKGTDVQHVEYVSSNNTGIYINPDGSDNWQW